MGFPIEVSLLTIELKEILKADSKPTPPNGYKIALIEDLGYTGLWLVYKLIQ